MNALRCVFLALILASSRGQHRALHGAQRLLERVEGLVTDGAMENSVLQPTLAELYALLESLFDAQAIRDFIDLKNRTDPHAAQLLRNVDTYMRGADAVTIVKSFWAEPELAALVAYLHANGLSDIYDGINAIHLRYGYPPVQSLHSPAQGEITEWLANAERGAVYEHVPTAVALVHEFLRTLPLNDLRKWLEFAVWTDAGRALYERLANAEVRSAYRKLRDLDQNKRLRLSLLSHGFEVDTLKKIVEVVMTWEKHTSVGLRTDTLHST